MKKSQMTIKSQINEILKTKSTFDVPDRLMEILQDKTEREKVFKEMLKLFNYKLDFDWFHEYFQEIFADKKGQGQVFTSPNTADLMAMLVPIETGFVLDPCAGTGALTIGQWNQVSNKENYKPSDYLFTCEELSGNAIPFLIFNLAIRGMTGVVNHCNTRTRESWGIFLILNRDDNPESFSNITRMPYHETSEAFFNVRFIEEKYPDQIEV